MQKSANISKRLNVIIGEKWVVRWKTNHKIADIRNGGYHTFGHEILVSICTYRVVIDSQIDQSFSQNSKQKMFKIGGI